MARARSLDHHLETFGKTVGPLHGLPISLKDTFKIAGYDSSIGLTSLCFKPCASTSPLVSILLSAGAVLYCKTNVPQTMMQLDSVNYVYGRTLNGLNRLVTAGGSSGGEGSLAGMKGSVLGIGTDIGGSVRVPAMCNGVFGINPSAGRVPHMGQTFGSLPGLSSVGLSARTGPLTRSLRDCELFFKTVSAAQPWFIDPDVVPGPWETWDSSLSLHQPRQNPLTIGILRTDNLVNPLPPIANLLSEVADALKASGVRVLEIPAPHFMHKALELTNALFGLEGGNSMLDLVEATGEPMTPWLAGRYVRKPHKTLAAAADLHAQREVMAAEFARYMWRQAAGPGVTVEVDAFVCPVAAHPVPPIDRYAGVSYTAPFVMLDLPSGVVPIRLFEERDLKGEVVGAPLGRLDAVTRELWDPATIDRKVYLGSPLCVQVVAPRLQERRLYRAMQAVDQAVHSKGKASSKL